MNELVYRAIGVSALKLELHALHAEQLQIASMIDAKMQKLVLQDGRGRRYSQ